MKYTLLELTQLVLSSMDSDEVDSWDETPESTQVTHIVKSVYNDIVSRADLPELHTLFQLTETDADSPTIMTVPDAVNSVKWIKYNIETSDDTDDKFTLLTPLTVHEFLYRMHGLDEGDTTNVGTFSYTVGTDSMKFFYNKPFAPQYYTVLDDVTIAFDSIDTGVDTYLTAAKTLAYGQQDPTFTFSNAFTPDLDSTQFSLLINEAKALAWAELKQAQHAKAEVTARRGWVTMQRKQERVKGPTFFDGLPNYGRK
jgi:hypothetical protein